MQAQRSRERPGEGREYACLPKPLQVVPALIPARLTEKSNSLIKFIYDNPLAFVSFVSVLFVLIIAAAYCFSQIFSGRAAYIHVGAIIGTIMVGNVFRIIMPAQRALVAAIKEGRTPDPALPAKGLLRSRHNNYFTLPVLFIMISNHFPSTYGSAYNWLILAGIA